MPHYFMYPKVTETWRVGAATGQPRGALSGPMAVLVRTPRASMARSHHAPGDHSAEPESMSRVESAAS